MKYNITKLLNSLAGIGFGIYGVIEIINSGVSTGLMHLTAGNMLIFTNFSADKAVIRFSSLATGLLLILAIVIFN